MKYVDVEVEGGMWDPVKDQKVIHVHGLGDCRLYGTQKNDRLLYFDNPECTTEVFNG